MAQPEFVERQSAGELAAIDVQANETELRQMPGRTWNTQGSQTTPEFANEAREPLSESTDLSALMSAILGDDARERVPVEHVSQSRPVELSDSAPDAAFPWQLELDTLLAEQQRREVAAARHTSPAPAVAAVAPGRFSALVRFRASVPGWSTSRVSLLTLSALAGMTLSVWAWQSAMGDRAPLSRLSQTVVTAAEAPAATPPDRRLPTSTSTEAATASPAVGDTAEERLTGLPRVSSATPSTIARGRTASAPPTDGREPASAPLAGATPTRAATSPIESAPAGETSPGPETTRAPTETGIPPTSSAASPASPFSVNGAGAARIEAPILAPSVAVRRTEPRLLRRAVPEYPSHLRRAKVGGSVTVAMTVDAEGRVVNALSVSGPTALRPAAEAAAQRWRYEPATVNGAPLERIVNVTFNFDPSDVSR